MKKSLIFYAIIMINIQLFAQDKSSNDGIPDYSTKSRAEVPEEYKWNISDIFPDIGTWKTEMSNIVILTEKIPAMQADWTSSSSKMLEFYKLTDEISIKGEKLYSYAALQSDMDLGNTELQAMKGQITTFFVDFGSKLSFVNEDILKLGIDKFNQYVKEQPEIATYRFGVEKILKLKNHILPSDEQKIVSLTGLFSSAAGDASGMLNNVELPAINVTISDGTEVPLNVANYVKYRSSKNPEDRKLVMTTFWKNHAKFENTFAILLNAEIKQHFFEAQVHNYNTCLESSLSPNNIDTSVYTKLISSVHSHLNSLHRYLAIKKELLGLETYRYDDIYASAVKSVSKKYTYDEAEKLIMESMKPLGNNYLDLLKKAFSERWIDRYPNQGKESGAYSSGLFGVHPYIKMNYNGEYDAVSTLTHELGHAMHSYLSCGKQDYANHQYVTFLAEIASTFNENLLIKYLLKTETDDFFKLYLLDKYLEGVRGTIFRQTLFAEFELSMHKHVESGQTLTADWLNDKYLSLTREYYGDEQGVMEVGEYIKDEWSFIPHFYMNYYVYQYATGLIASMALSEMVLNGGEQEKQKYIDFLSAGGSDYPLNILQNAGLDMTTSAPTDAAFKYIDGLIDEMERIVAKLKKEGRL